MKKNQIKFSLDRPNSDKPTYIFLKYACADGLLKYSTRQTVLPSEWSDSLQRAKERVVNMALDQHYTITEQYTESCRIMGGSPVYKLDLIKELDEKLNRKERGGKKKESHFFTTMDFLIGEMESGKVTTPQNTKYTPGSIRNHKRSRNRLYDFNPNLEFNTITIKTYHSFIGWCNDRGYTLNYISALIKDWKTFMSITLEKGYHKNHVATSKEFKRVSEDSFQIYLDDLEIKKLYSIDLSKSSLRENIRDRFVISLYSGLRISDMLTLTMSNINIEKNILIHVNKKTGKRVVMPVHPLIKEIIKKYKGSLPRQYSEQVVNREIKKIAKAAGFTELVTFSKTVGGVRTTFTKEKWQMISTHSCRRSMVTNLLKATDIQSVMPVMGMSLKTVAKYNKRSGEENAAMLQSNSYFSL